MGHEILQFLLSRVEDNELQSEIWVRSGSELRSWMIGNGGAGMVCLENFISRRTEGKYASFYV